jgi:hypothetical protein
MTTTKTKTPEAAHEKALADIAAWQEEVDRLAAIVPPVPDSPANIDSAGVEYAAQRDQLTVAQAGLAAAKTRARDAANPLLRLAADRYRAAADVEDTEAETARRRFTELKAEADRHGVGLYNLKNVNHRGDLDPDLSAMVKRHTFRAAELRRDARCCEAAADGHDVVADVAGQFSTDGAVSIPAFRHLDEWGGDEVKSWNTDGWGVAALGHPGAEIRPSALPPELSGPDSLI